ncbi:MAG: PAS domain S-box protein [Chromatiaceae bacterium]|nr:PAS domain S-box protein [Chromatiaceae bacterium]MCP5313629.1 PAS domain S-box protein [Chromatiaceae bacterium]
MKNPIAPTAIERSLVEDSFIVSKTDPKGRITYANPVFMEISGYAEHELLGKQHNIVRHPDMPRAVFGLMWDTLKQGREFFGYVKNLAKDGSFYWTFANVTPSLDAGGHLLGYYSVRRMPKRSALELLGDVYARMCEIEKAEGPNEGPRKSAAYLTDIVTREHEDYDRFVLAL